MRETSFLLVARGDAACPTFRTCPGMGHVVANFLLVVSRKLLGWKPLLLGARKLLGAPCVSPSCELDTCVNLYKFVFNASYDVAVEATQQSLPHMTILRTCNLRKSGKPTARRSLRRNKRRFPSISTRCIHFLQVCFCLGCFVQPRFSDNTSK